MILNEVVDPSILGGFVVENAAILIDSNFRGQLDAMCTRLSEVPMLPVSIHGVTSEMVSNAVVGPRRAHTILRFLREMELAGAAAKGKP